MTDFNHFQDKCIERLKQGCPVCGEQQLVFIESPDGLPKDQVFRARYECGAHFVVGSNGIHAETGCPEPSDLKADELNQEIMDACDAPGEVPLS